MYIKKFIIWLTKKMSEYHVLWSVVFASLISFIIRQFINDSIFDGSRNILNWTLIIGLWACSIIYLVISIKQISTKQKFYDSIIIFLLINVCTLLIGINDLLKDNTWNYIRENNIILFTALITTPIYIVGTICYRLISRKRLKTNIVEEDSEDNWETIETQMDNKKREFIATRENARFNEQITREIFKSKTNRNKTIMRISGEFVDYSYYDDDTMKKNYINNRLIPQIAWYNRKSDVYQKSYKTLTFISSIITGAIPILSLLVNNGSVNMSSTLLIIAVLGTLGTAITSFVSLHNFRELCIKYKTNCEVLKSTLHRYLTKSGEFSRENDLNTLVLICEQYIVKEFESFGNFISTNSDEQGDKNNGRNK